MARTKPVGAEERRIDALLREAQHPMGRIVPTADRSCEGKVKYSPRTARIVAQDMRTNHKENFEAYACRFCSAWHVGRTPRPVPETPR